MPGTRCSRSRAKRIGQGALFLSWLLFLGVEPAKAIEHSFSEDFSTADYKDAVHTTADWSLTAGRLRLFPFTPNLIGSRSLPGATASIQLSGRYAYMTAWEYGLHVVDVSNPTSPVLIGNYDTPRHATDLVIRGAVAYVADMESGLQIIDVSDPTNPALLGSYDTPHWAHGLDVSGTVAYVADYETGLLVVDASDPSAPALLGSCDTPGHANHVAVSGTLAYVADDEAGLQIIDVSDPANPVTIGSLDTPDLAIYVAVSGNRAYVADKESGLLVVDVSDPAHPALLGICDTPGWALAVTVAGTTAYVGDRFSGVQIIDVSDPANPTLSANCDTPDEAFGIAVAGTVAYVADHNSGLQVIRVGEHMGPALVGRADTPEDARHVAISGPTAYVAACNAGLQIFDVGDPTAPVLLGSYNTPGFACDIAISGKVAYVADETGGLQIVHVGNPASPALLGIYTAPALIEGVAISGAVAYTAAWTAGLQIVDVRNPASPALLGGYDTPSYAYDVAVSGSVAYVADYSGLQIVDVSDPVDPAPLGSFPLDYAIRVAVSGTVACVADYVAGLKIFDVSDPGAPLLLGTYHTPGGTRDVALSGSVAYVTDDTGLRVIDVSNPASPALMGSYDTPSLAIGVAVSGATTYVGNYAAGFQIFEVIQNRFDLAHNAARSLPVDDGSDPIQMVRLTTAQVDNAAWELSADGGAHWQSKVPGGGWLSLAAPGPDLLWRASLAPAPPVFSAIPPEASQVQIDWLYQFPVIDAIGDVAGDQGRQVRLEWTRNAHDFVGSSPQVVEYAIFRKIDPLAIAAGLTTASAAAETDPELAEALAAGWDFVATVPADAEDEYAMVVPTIADSSIAAGQSWSVFKVRARTATPGVFFESYPDSGYSVDNLPPLPPGEFSGHFPGASEGLVLTWNAGEEPDLSYYELHRGAEVGFEPSPENLWHTTRTTSLTDPECVPGTGYVYKLCAVDRQGNQSPFTEFSSDVAVSNSVAVGAAVALPGRCEIRWRLRAEADASVFRVWRSVERSPFALYIEGQIALAEGDWVLTDRGVEPSLAYAYRIGVTDGVSETLLFETAALRVPDALLRLYPNQPNPFNPRTTIRYSLPRTMHVTLAVYDQRGRRVRTLVDAEVPAGEQMVEWDGRDGRGLSAASGTYVVRLVTDQGVRTGKATLTR